MRGRGRRGKKERARVTSPRCGAMRARCGRPPRDSRGAHLGVQVFEHVLEVADRLAHLGCSVEELAAREVRAAEHEQRDEEQPGEAVVAFRSVAVPEERRAALPEAGQPRADREEPHDDHQERATHDGQPPYPGVHVAVVIVLVVIFRVRVAVQLLDEGRRIVRGRVPQRRRHCRSHRLRVAWPSDSLTARQNPSVCSKRLGVIRPAPTSLWKHELAPLASVAV